MQQLNKFCRLVSLKDNPGCSVVAKYLLNKGRTKQKQSKTQQTPHFLSYLSQASFLVRKVKLAASQFFRWPRCVLDDSDNIWPKVISVGVYWLIIGKYLTSYLALRSRDQPDFVLKCFGVRKNPFPVLSFKFFLLAVFQNRLAAESVVRIKKKMSRWPLCEHVIPATPTRGWGFAAVILPSPPCKKTRIIFTESSSVSAEL